MSKDLTVSSKKKPPIILIIVAIFLIIITIYDCFSWIGDKNRDIIYWLKPMPLIVYTVFWIFATFMKRWGAFAFIFLTILHFGIFIFAPKFGWELGNWEKVIVQNFMVQQIPVNIALSILLLLHLKKMK